VVTDVHKGPNGTTVLVKTIRPMEEGDKLSNRIGGKGVVGKVIPDEQMPHTRDGRPAEILVNPLGVISRGNPMQMVEGALGKVAEKTGQRYKIPDWQYKNIDDLTALAEGELKKHGLSDTEDMIDPETGRLIPNIFVGNAFFMKLHHMAEDKAQARSTGAYTASDLPAKGGPQSAKRLGLLDSNALLSHGAYNVLRDVKLVKGQRNDDYWLSFMQGHRPPDPKVPLVYQKFVHELQAAGINVVPDGPRLHIMALTNHDIQHLAGNRSLRNAETVQADKGLRPIDGGLFSADLTGGHGGFRWSKLDLHEPMPSPVFEDPIRRVLGLTKDQFSDVIAGKRTLQDRTGPEAIAKALDKINLPQQIAVARAQIAGGKKTARDMAIRKLGYLRSAQELGIHPREWVLNSVPVLPPKFRPISIMAETGVPLVSDPNYLYHELWDANENLKNMKGQVEDVGEERLALYNAFKAVTGLGEPVHPKLVEKGVRGILHSVLGSGPKYSAMQRQLLGTTTDLVGRGVIAPNPNLDMDHVGLPEEQAWDIYKNFVVRRLKLRGIPLGRAVEAVTNRDDVAKHELIKEMAERPVILNRAPVLHRFGIMALHPRLVKGNVIELSPLITKGFNADFDGDAMQFHVPVSEDARREAIERMLPSRNLLSPADFKTPMHGPTQEMVGGLYEATTARNDKRAPTRYRNAKDAINAFLQGRADVGDRIEIAQ
jgi:hypothetical protein